MICSGGTCTCTYRFQGLEDGSMIIQENGGMEYELTTASVLRYLSGSNMFSCPLVWP